MNRNTTKTPKEYVIWSPYAPENHIHKHIIFQSELRLYHLVLRLYFKHWPSDCFPLCSWTRSP